VDGLNVNVVWQDSTAGNPEIYFKRSVDGGVIWQANKRLTNSADDSKLPAIGVDGSSIYVVWNERVSGSQHIYYTKGALD
jgi:hypothetical protein